MEKKNRSSLIIIIILLLLLMATIAVTVWAVFFRDTTPVLAPDYAPQEEDKNAIDLNDKDTEKLEQSEGGGAVTLSFTKEIVVDLATKTAAISFDNPARSNQNMLLQLEIKGVVVAQTGLLRPGRGVRRLDLFDNAVLSPGVYNGKYKVYYYQDDTGEKTIVNTEIPLKITVQ